MLDQSENEAWAGAGEGVGGRWESEAVRKRDN